MPATSAGMTMILLRDLHRGRLPVHRYVARLAGDALEPGSDRGKAGEIEAAFIGGMRIGVQSDVGDRVVPGREEIVPREVLFHDAKRLIAVFGPVLERMGLQFASALHQR